MTLPDFLGLGAQRAGTTWLDRALRRHPDLFLPTRRKEVHYFDEHYRRGPEWYARFFPDAETAARYRRIGEITPRYLFDPAVPRRIHRLLPECRMLVLLRNPVTRLYSQYGLHVRDRGERRDFATFSRQHRDAFQRGLYSIQLARYFELFERDQFLILIYEEMVGRGEDALTDVADFLDLDVAPLREQSTDRVVNPSYAPRFPRLRLWARKVGTGLRSLGADGTVNLAKRFGVPAWFGHRAMPSLAPDDRAALAEAYRDEIARLEELLGRSLAVWTEED